MLGAVIILVLFYIGLFQLVRFYDNAYKHDWYYKYQDKKRKLKRKFKLANKSEKASNNQILGIQN